MKNSILILTLFTCFAGVGLSSCDSAQKNVRDAEDKLESANQALAEAKKDSIQEADWQAFKRASQEKIADNNVKISVLKTEKKYLGTFANTTYKKEIQALEDRNFVLQRRMDDYEKYNSSWEAFKREFNQDMEELGKSLKDITVNNSK